MKPEPAIIVAKRICCWNVITTPTVPPRSCTNPPNSASMQLPTSVAKIPAQPAVRLNIVREIAAEEMDAAPLFTNWQSADKLHIHADREHLTAFQYDEAWQKAQEFIDTMLTIYHRNA